MRAPAPASNVSVSFLMSISSYGALKANVSAKAPFQQKSAASLDMDKTSRNKCKCSRRGTSGRNPQAFSRSLGSMFDLSGWDNCAASQGALIASIFSPTERVPGDHRVGANRAIIFRNACEIAPAAFSRDRRSACGRGLNYAGSRVGQRGDHHRRKAADMIWQAAW